MYLRQVMEQCVARLDVAMFNAILRESAHEIPTDPISDPIVDSKVLPIPAGDLSFGSGAQLKNSVCTMSVNFFFIIIYVVYPVGTSSSTKLMSQAIVVKFSNSCTRYINLVL